MLLHSDSKYGDKVLIQFGTRVIDTTLQVITESYQMLAIGGGGHISVQLFWDRIMSRQT